MSGEDTQGIGDGGPTQTRVVHSSSQERYELIVGDSGDADGEKYVGYVDYVPEPDQVVITHTVVYEQFAGHGYAGVLVQHVLDDIRAAGKKVVPVCSYVQRFIEKHPAYQAMAVPVPK